ncbi:hypothetical protein, partial [Pseudomonas syringae]|uniref:hypothetical protein n=1 Tax=Pseudomonas syringae TaxID=317 RepID=UPI0019675AB0
SVQPARQVLDVGVGQVVGEQHGHTLARRRSPAFAVVAANTENEPMTVAQMPIPCDCLTGWGYAR